MPDLARTIEHTLLSPDASLVALERLVVDASALSLFAVCVPSCRVAEVRSMLRHRPSEVRLVTVVAFPNGAVNAAVKAAETKMAVDEGADEIDVVANLGLVRDGEIGRCRDEIAAVVDAAGGRIVKVILEVGLLTDAEKRDLGRAAIDAGARCLKTSTGLEGRGGATTHDVKLLREIAGPHLLVKASGGIRTRADALAMIAAGADRIGTSSGPRIVSGSELT